MVLGDAERARWRYPETLTRSMVLITAILTRSMVPIITTPTRHIFHGTSVALTSSVAADERPWSTGRSSVFGRRITGPNE